MRRTPLLLPFLALCACAQPFEGRVANRLAEAGLPRPMADCMAGRWVDRLSIAQLQKISSLSEDLKHERREDRLTVVTFLDRVRQVDDPEIYKVVSSSTIACAFAS